MGVVTAFIQAALPLVITGIALACVSTFANARKTKEDK